MKELFNKIAKNNSIAPAEREEVVMKKTGAVIESDSTNELASQIALLTTQFSTFLKAQSQQSLTKPVLHCGLCQENHPTEQCPQLAEVNAIKNFQRNQGNPSWQPLQQQGQNQGQSNWGSNQGQ